MTGQEILWFDGAVYEFTAQPQPLTHEAIALDLMRFPDVAFVVVTNAFLAFSKTRNRNQETQGIVSSN